MKSAWEKSLSALSFCLDKPSSFRSSAHLFPLQPSFNGGIQSNTQVVTEMGELL